MKNQTIAIIVIVIIVILVGGYAIFAMNQSTPAVTTDESGAAMSTTTTDQTNTSVSGGTQTTDGSGLAPVVITNSTTTITTDATTTPGGAAVVRIAIKNYALSNTTLTVKKGTLVIWSNSDSEPQTVTSTDGSFDSGTLNQSQSFQYAFNKVGTFNYYSKTYPNIKGTIVVGQ